MKRLLLTGALAASLLAISPATPVAARQAPVPAQVVVKLSAGVDARAFANAHGASLTQTLLRSRNVHLISSNQLFDPNKVGKESDSLASSFGKDGAVIWADAEGNTAFSDERFHAWPFAEPSGSNSALAANAPMFERLHLPDAQRLASGRGAVVAVLDTGVAAKHPMFGGTVVPGYDFVSDDSSPSEAANKLDDDGDGVTDRAMGHGTFVAGLVHQIAPGARILSVRVVDDEGRAHAYSIIEGITYAVEQGATVINLSLGVQSREYSGALEDAIADARKAGVVVVAAAGNGGDDNKQYPAAFKDVIAVAALGTNGEQLADFSCRGKWVDVAAPGVALASAMPGGKYAIWGGSSMAAPLVSGQVALLSERNPGSSPSDLEKLVWKSALKLHPGGQVERGSIDFLVPMK
jgi:subtilisin family serine protease